MTKNLTYQIRLPEDLLTQFRLAAKARDRSPAAEVRDFMRAYVNHGGNTSPPWLKGPGMQRVKSKDDDEYDDITF